MTGSLSAMTSFIDSWLDNDPDLSGNAPMIKNLAQGQALTLVEETSQLYTLVRYSHTWSVGHSSYPQIESMWIYRLTFLTLFFNHTWLWHDSLAIWWWRVMMTADKIEPQAVCVPPIPTTWEHTAVDHPTRRVEHFPIRRTQENPVSITLIWNDRL